MNNRIEMKHITKKFGDVVANDCVSLNLRPGEIHALLGENGAGKTTLMSILCGEYTADEGEIYIDRKHVIIDSPRIALQHKIGFVHQHPALADDLTIAENPENRKYLRISFNFEVSG